MRGIYYFPIILPFNFPVVLITKDYYQILQSDIMEKVIIV